MKPSLNVVLSPQLLYLYDRDISGSNVVVIDILRATTSMVYALHNGASRIKPVETPEEALEYKELGFITAAERNGLPVEGFDIGNSPESFHSERVKGRNIAMTTTNGTRCIHMAKKADGLYVGAFLNLTALADRLISDNKNLIILCAGWKDKVNLEDTLFAGALVQKLERNFSIDCDSAYLSMDLYTHALQQGITAYMQKASHARRFSKLGIDDLPFCFTTDTTNVIPHLQGEFLVNGAE